MHTLLKESHIVLSSGAIPPYIKKYHKHPTREVKSTEAHYHNATSWLQSQKREQMMKSMEAEKKRNDGSAKGTCAVSTSTTENGSAKGTCAVSISTTDTCRLLLYAYKPHHHAAFIAQIATMLSPWVLPAISNNSKKIDGWLIILQGSHGFLSR